jgi:hypothetical protein
MLLMDYFNSIFFTHTGLSPVTRKVLRQQFLPLSDVPYLARSTPHFPDESTAAFPLRRAFEGVATFIAAQ